jgi:Ca2+-transporting ATPase
MTADAVAERFWTNTETGLTSTQATEQFERIGPNAIREGRQVGMFGKVLKQFKNPLVFILLGAGVATLILHEYLDMIVIFVAVAINVVVGTFQEERASRAFEKLNQSQERSATVIRDGKKQVLPAEKLVPGDIVVIEVGAYVPADIRLVEAKNLTLNESVLTGEWVAVSKDPAPIEQEVPLAEQRNMAWMGTLVATGYGKGIVVESGSQTQVGIIAVQLISIDERTTPLEANIKHIAQFLLYVVVGAVGVLFLLGIFRGQPMGEMVLVAIAVAVATIPAGLPAAVTVVLALGMEAILKRGGLVKNLLAAETLGSTTIILTDKTGTLTEAKVRLAGLHTLESIRSKTNDVCEDDRKLLRMGVLASDAFVEENPDSSEELIVQGRAIEKAVVLFGLELGYTQEMMKESHPRVDYLPFESERRFRGTGSGREQFKHNRLYLSGVPEFLIERSLFVYKNGKREEMNARDRNQFLELQRRKSAEGYRFIGVAYRDVSWDRLPVLSDEEDAEKLCEGITFMGIIAFDDPVRADVAQSIAEVQGAGARVVMVTGDGPDTAGKVARDVGIAAVHDEILLGTDLEEMDDAALYQAIMRVPVFARVLPTQKLRIAHVLKSHGEVVAMTGDGVNDAPALRSANIGVAVGSGTEVAKEAADIVLLNDSFSIIVAAIEEGRRIIDNLKKIVSYLISTSFSEIFIIGGALVFGAPLPLLPTQILWANIVEEGLMSFAFAFEKKDPQLMRRNPRSDETKTIMIPEVRRLIFTVSAITGVFLVGLYFYLLDRGFDIGFIRTIMFATLSIDAIFFSFSLKSFDTPIWRISLFSNRFLLVAMLVSVALLLLALTFPPLMYLLSLSPLTPWAVALLSGVGLFNLLTIELAKFFFFERKVRQ